MKKRRHKKKRDEGKEEEGEQGRVAIPADQVVEMVEDAEEEMKKGGAEHDGEKIGVVARQLVQMLFAARASSLGAGALQQAYTGQLPCVLDTSSSKDKCITDRQRGGQCTQ